jgi:hypothetical protein
MTKYELISKDLRFKLYIYILKFKYLIMKDLHDEYVSRDQLNQI